MSIGDYAEHRASIIRCGLLRIRNTSACLGSYRICNQGFVRQQPRQISCCARETLKSRSHYRTAVPLLASAYPFVSTSRPQGEREDIHPPPNRVGVVYFSELQKVDG